MAIEQIKLFNKPINLVEKESQLILDHLKPIILSVPGISYNSAAAIIGTIGNFKAKHTRMSKRGNSLLRQQLVLTAFNLTLNNQTFKKYYDSKRKEGKNHYNALGHTASKLVRCLYKMMTENIPFNL